MHYDFCIAAEKLKFLKLFLFLLRSPRMVSVIIGNDRNCRVQQRVAVVTLIRFGNKNRTVARTERQ